MKRIFAMALLMCFSLKGQAQEKTKILRMLDLPRDAREQLRGHMIAFQASMQNIVDLTSRGRWKELEGEGKAIAQVELMPAKVLASQPGKFHAYLEELKGSAAELAKASAQGHGGGVLANYNRMLSTCMKCHADYAPNYFERHKDYSPPQDLPPKYYQSPYQW